MTPRRKELCKQSLVLDTIKNTAKKGGMTSAQIKLAEAQAEDYADMKKELQGLKTDLGEVRKEVGDVRVELSEIKGNVKTLLEISNRPKLTENKYFWIFITIIACLLAGMSHLSELKAFFGG